MKLTETFKIITEDSRKNIVSVLKLNKSLADRFHSIDSKNSFALAYSFLRWIEAHNSSHDVNREREPWEGTDTRVKDFMREIGQSLVHMFKERPHVASLVKKAKTLRDIDEILVKENKKMSAQTRKILLSFPDGMRWMRLDTREEKEEEAEKMDHCASDHRGDLFSLRDKDGHPHVTITYNIKKNHVYQMKGISNEVPDRKYMIYLKAFFKEFVPTFTDSFVKNEDPKFYAELKELSASLPPRPPELLDIVKSKWTKTCKEFIWPFISLIIDVDDYMIDDHEDNEQYIEELMNELNMTWYNVDADMYHDKVALSDLWQTRIPTRLPKLDKLNHGILTNTVLNLAHRRKTTLEDDGSGEQFVDDPMGFMRKNLNELQEFWQACANFIGGFGAEENNEKASIVNDILYMNEFNENFDLSQYMLSLVKNNLSQFIDPSSQRAFNKFISNKSLIVQYTGLDFKSFTRELVALFREYPFLKLRDQYYFSGQKPTKSKSSSQQEEQIARFFDLLHDA